MVQFNRRKFLQASSILLATSFVQSSFFKKENINPLLSFSTLGCPDWNFQKITEFAVIHNYSGIELRGILHEMDLTKCNEFISAENIKSTLALMKDKNLKFVDLGSSAMLHFPEGDERKKSLDEAKRFIDLAQKINCPFVRVFPNKFPKEQEKNVTMDFISKGLLELGNYSKEKNVMVLMETHGDLVKSEDIEKVMQTAEHQNVGLVWDVANMWSITKEPVEQVYQKLKKYIHHTHIKDGKMDGDKINYVLLGKGDVPIFAAIDILSKGGYKGYYSFEWEKLWHPEILDSEIALADYPVAMKNHFKN